MRASRQGAPNGSATHRLHRTTCGCAAYVLAFIHLGSRKVFLSPSTFDPTGEWMQQQGRNVSLWAAEEGIDVRFLIHDRDTKYRRRSTGCSIVMTAA